MTEEIIREPIDVDEKIGVVFGGKHTEVTIGDLQEELEVLRSKHMQQHWVDLKLKLEHTGERKNGLQFVLYGVRKETEDEALTRVKKQEAELAFIDQQKWKEYQRLKRYFDEKKKASEEQLTN